MSGWFRLETLKAQVDSRGWYDLADRFRSSDPTGELSADIDTIKAGVPVGPWMPNPIRHSSSRAQFETIALLAIQRVEVPIPALHESGGAFFSNEVCGWLDVVWSCMLLSKEFIKSHQDEGVEYARTIYRVCEACAVVCTVIANQAREIELGARSSITMDLSAQERAPKELIPEPRKGRVGKKPVRRNQKYKVIDAALEQVADGRPSTQKEVFQSLDARHVVIPPAEPFVAARGWIAGFRRDPPAARAWLSKRWTELSLSPLPRGPKNSKK